MRTTVITRRISYEQGVYWSVFIIGLLIMAYGIALMITANLGSAPWDVFHIGLFLKLGLTIGTWSIIVGFVIIVITTILTKKWPRTGAFANMVLVGVFIDLFLSMPGMVTPHSLLAKYLMLAAGILFNGIGISIYISAQRGAGPRDTLMLFLTEKTGWKLSNVRRCMELFVLLLGWLMGGPVFIGTFVFGLTIGTIVGAILPICNKWVAILIERGERFEDFHKRPIRSDHHDGARETCK